MAGPRGGGGFGGGSFGGGGFRGGGGFGGGYRGPRGPHFGGFWLFGRRRYYGGGCLGALLAPFIILGFVVIFLVLMITATVSSAVNGDIRYDEEVFQDYTAARYDELFDPSSRTYEDKVLVVFLTNEEHDGYYAIAWMGDNLTDAVANELAGEYSTLGRAISSSVADNYKYSLAANLASAVRTVEATVKTKGDPYYIDTGAQDHSRGVIYNYTELEINEDTVNSALASFSASTDITMAIVVDDAVEVFGKGIGVAEILVIILLIAIIVTLVIVIVKRIKNNKNGGNDDGTGYERGESYNERDGYNAGGYNGDYYR